MRRVSSQAMKSALTSASRIRARDVVEVADRGRADDQPARHQRPAAPRLRRASSTRASAAAPIMPASLPSVAARIGVSFIGFSARSRTSRRAGSSSRSPARMTPPPTTIAFGWKMLAKLAQATPSRVPIRSKTAIAVSSPASAASVTAVPSTVLPSAQQLAEGRVGRAFGRRPALAAERGAGGERLDAAVVRAVALAGRAVGLDHDVAELGAGAGRAAVDLAVEDQAAADPGADGQHHHVRLAAGGAEEVLGEGGDVAVVVDEDRQPDPLFDEVADRQVGERQVDGGDGDAALVVDRRRDPEPDRGGLGARLARRADLADQQLDQLVLGLAGRGLAAAPTAPRSRRGRRPASSCRRGRRRSSRCPSLITAAG